MISYAVRRWGSLDALARRILKNVGVIGGGDAVASLIGLVSLALMARALGPDLLGLFVMMEAYGTLIARWIRPETWQVLIKYGADALAADDRDAFRRLIKLSVLIDLGGCLGAFAVALVGLEFASFWFGWEDDVVALAGIYCIVLILEMASTSTAVLRLFNRFRVFAYTQISTALLRLALTALAWWFEGGLAVFVLIALAVTALRPVLIVKAAFGELKRQGYDGIAGIPLRGVHRQYPGLWRFLLSTNLSLLLRKTVETTDVLIVGALLGPAASGGLHVAKRLAMLIRKVAKPIQQVLYPDVSKLWAKGEIERFRKVVGWANLIGGSVGLLILGVIALAPDLLLRLFAGEAFADLSVLLLVQMLSVVIFMFGLSLRLSLYSMEQDVALLKVVAVATVAFYLTFFALVPSTGVVAAGLGHCVFNLVWLVLCQYVFQRRLAAPRRRQEIRPPISKDW
jgi:O-antigen/teichoic acid export membrane protein